MPKMSIIVPIYNVDEYLERCICSILAQTFADFELILVNDGSTDQSGLICDNYQIMDQRIKVIHKQNEGVSVARNIALDIAEGKYIIFCDSDDSWKKGLLQKVYEVAEKRNSDCTIFNYDKISGNKVIWQSNFVDGVFEMLDESSRMKYLMEYFFRYRHGYEVWSRVFKNEIIKRHHLRFCTNCNNFAEDYGFVAKYLLYAKRIICLPESMYNYYLRENSMMSNSSSLIKLDELNEVSFDFWQEYKKIYAESKYLKDFHVFHFMFMYNQYQKIIGTEKYPFLKEELDKIKRYDWYEENVKQNIKNYRKLKLLFGKNNARKILLFDRYCRHKNWERFRYESFLFYKFLLKK